MKNTQSDFPSFEQVVKDMGFSIEQLRVEKVIATSMNNYVINVNCNGVTWAIGIRYPKNLTPHEFVAEKERTIQVSNYLASLFEKGIPLHNNDHFVFASRSVLASNASTKEFFKQQALLPPLVINGTKKEIKGITIDEADLVYPGPFLITKGAPAHETLEYDFAFHILMLQGLATMHVFTGAKKYPDSQTMRDGLEKIYAVFIKNSDKWIPQKGSSEEKRVETYRQEFGEEQNIAIKREVFLQSSESTHLLRGLTEETFSNFIHNPDYHSFVHGDPHGANFIIVQRGSYNEVHPIDVDTGRGIIPSEKECYLLDVVVLYLSIYNWSTIHKTKQKTFGEMVEEYTDMFNKQLKKV